MPRAMTPEFDLHGAVGIRLVDADPGDARIIERQLGPIGSTLDREPDIVIRFVDRMPLEGRLRYLGLDEAAFTDDAYLVLRGRQKSSVQVAIPLDALGTGRLEIVAERGLSAIPLLVPLVNLTAFANGWLPLHAGAFVHDGLGVLTIGWAKGGKSETLLSFTAQGADLVGDEWVHIDPAARRIRALPEPMRVWDWQIRSAGLEDRIPARDRRRLAATRAASSALLGVTRLPIIGGSAIGRVATRARPVVERQLSVQVPPDRLLGRAALPDGAALDRVVLVMSHASEDMTVAPVDPADVARRATQSFLFELSDLLEHYRRHLFAFPDRRSALLDELETRHADATLRALDGVSAIAVGHPYPLEIGRLYEAIAPALA